ncbi:CAAX prenyl protease 1 [Asimina triloba]
METQWMTEFPHTSMDKRPRKRPRLTWDIPPVIPMAPAVGNATISNHSLASSLYCKGGARNGSPPWRNDDKDGHYIFAIGENLTPRYKILSKMGEGTFGQVVECWDMEKKESVAIKIVRSIQKYREAAMIEIDVLQKLAKNDIGGTRKDGSYFKNLPKSSAIKLIDFGSTTFEHLDHTYVVSTRHYRAPEGLDGITLVIYGVWVAFLSSCVRRRAEKYFRRGSRLDWPEGATSRESMRAVWKLPRLQNLIMQHVDHSAGDLIDLLQGLLCYDPNKRLKAHEALMHPFFTRDLRSRKLANVAVAVAVAVAAKLHTAGIVKRQQTSNGKELADLSV